jgi:YesN/AraC family two-component response regulator
LQSRILFVDDEPGIRHTLPLILEQHGFQVTATASVPEALHAITTQKFDVLISDLNIGEAGDGFTVVSAMRRTQPKCVNLILTGYPAFESALQALRSHVDDYLVKPAEIGALVDSIEQKLANPVSGGLKDCVKLAPFLRDHEPEIIARALAGMKSHTRLSRVPLSDEERTDHIPVVVQETAAQLESSKPDRPTDRVLAAGARHGESRRKQGYGLPMLVDDTRVLDSAIYDVVQNNLIRLDLSTLIPDLSRLNDALEAQLQEAVQAFVEKQAA